MKQEQTQNVSLTKNEQEKNETKGFTIPTLDLDTKKELAKIGMTASMGITVATAFYMKNKFMKNLHVGAGVALVGFSFWHHMLYQPDKKKAIKQPQTKKIKEPLAIHLNEFYIELSIDGKLTTEELSNFEEKIESLLEDYNIENMNILVDIRNLKKVELTAFYDDLLFGLKHFNEFKKIGIIGSKKFEEYSVKIADTITPFEMKYFRKYETAHKWLID